MHLFRIFQTLTVHIPLGFFFFLKSTPAWDPRVTLQKFVPENDDFDGFPRQFYNLDECYTSTIYAVVSPNVQITIRYCDKMTKNIFG